MIKNILLTTPNGPNYTGYVYDSVAFGDYVCLVGYFNKANSFNTNSIALVNSTTGNLDTTSPLAVALSTLFPLSTQIKSVLYTESNGHPCLIFIVGTSSNNRCYVFFINELFGNELIISTPKTFTNPIDNTMNTSFYYGMAISEAQNLLFVIGSFYVSSFTGNGCAIIDIDSIWASAPNGAILNIIGTNSATNTPPWGALAVDDSTSKLYLHNRATANIDVYSITNSPTPTTYVTSIPIQLNGSNVAPGYPSAGYSTGKGYMWVSNSKLFFGLMPNPLYILIYDLNLNQWQTNYIHILRNQAFGITYTKGSRVYNGKLYIWGGTTNAWYPQKISTIGNPITLKDYKTNARQGLIVFDITGTYPALIGEDLALSKGKPWLTYYPPISYNPYEQSSFPIHAHIDDSGVYVFNQKSPYAYSVTPNHLTAVSTRVVDYKNGIQYDANPVRVSLDGIDATNSFEANLLY